VRCSVLQCLLREDIERCVARSLEILLAVCCSMLQYVAVCCSVLQCVAVCCSVLPCDAVCCSVLQCLFREDTQ